MAERAFSLADMEEQERLGERKGAKSLAVGGKNKAKTIIMFAKFENINNSYYFCCTLNFKRPARGREKTMPYPNLNLPAAELRLSQSGGQPTVLDPLRRRYVRLTPEEWVRQHFTAFLIQHKGYPAGLLANEVTLDVNGLARRCDTVLYGHDRQPLMVIEYKAPQVALTQRVFDQVWRYNTVLRVEWLIVSNGLQTIVCHLDKETGTYEFLPEVPEYDGLRA